jgi:hypothetical protein
MMTKRRGRPKATQPRGSSVTAWIPQRDHDALIQRARREATTVSALLRKMLADQVRRPAP